MAANPALITRHIGRLKRTPPVLRQPSPADILHVPFLPPARFVNLTQRRPAPTIVINVLRNIKYSRLLLESFEQYRQELGPAAGVTRNP